MNALDQSTATQETPTAAQVLDSSNPKQPVPLPTQPAPEGEPPPAAAKEEKISPKLAALVRRERAAVERERAAKSKEVEIQAKLAELEERSKKYQEFETLRSTNPRKALELLGLTYGELSQIELNDGNIPPELQIKKLSESLENRIDERVKKTTEEAQRRAEEEAKRAAEARESETISKFKGEISSFLKENTSRYELIAFEQCEDLVYDVIDEHYERTRNPETGMGEVLTIAQAADKVELHLEQKYEKARNLNKVKSFPALKQEQAKPKTTNPNPGQPTKTLTNQMSATPSPQSNRMLTDDERIARAVAYAKGLFK